MRFWSCLPLALACVACTENVESTEVPTSEPKRVRSDTGSRLLSEL